MTPSSSTDGLQTVLAYRFTNEALLEEALTHSSYVNERKPAEGSHNERLEFLGDAVLSLVMSEYLASRLPLYSEGALSKLKAKLVSESSLARVARRLKLGEHLKLGRGEERSGGREKDSLLSDAIEAVIAAVHLDGGFAASRSVTLRLFEDELRTAVEDRRPGAEDYKTQFQEWCQKRYDRLPRYDTVRESGPDHDKVFEVQVSVKDHVLGTGIGRSKKEAEQLAAKQALERTESPANKSVLR
ncbi:MAG TPA: ribonuclease III [Nitrospira sp.]|nr:ribonuclease III [Nitrospira sp.]